MDPLSSDNDRVTADGRTIQTFLDLAEDGGAAAVRCYVPVQVHFSLLGVCIRTLRIGNKKRKGATKKAKKTEIGMLSIGDPKATVSRVVAGTLYFSSETASNVWDCLRNVGAGGGRREDRRISDNDADYCYNTEASKHFEVGLRRPGCLCASLSQSPQLFQRLWREDQLVHSCRHAAVYALLTNQPKYIPTLCRVLNSLPAQIQRCIDCVDVVCQVLSTDNVIASNMTILGHTITRYTAPPGTTPLTRDPQAHLLGAAAVRHLPTLLALVRSQLHPPTVRYSRVQPLGNHRS